MIKIGYAEGNQKQISLRTQELEFEEFGNSLKECLKGGKYESYFIRGGNLLEYKDYVSAGGHKWGTIYPRIDSCLISADLLIIDADAGKDGSNAEHLYTICDSLVAHGINHSGYTSHSQTNKINKCRVVIPCRLPEKKYLVPTIRKLIKFLCSMEFIKQIAPSGL